MKSVVSLAAFVLCAYAGSANAMLILDSSAAHASPIADNPYAGRAGPTVFSSVPGPYSAFGVATGVASFDDYVSTQGAAFNLAQFQFVGGVAQAGGGITVAFFDTASNPVNSFHTTLPSAGDFIWTITLGAQADGGDSTFSINPAGFVQITIDAANTGRWFFTSTLPATGSDDVTIGTGSTLNPQRNNAYGLIMVPAPAGTALLGLGLFAASRRRR
jgi:hypothetical protein